MGGRSSEGWSGEVKLFESPVVIASSIGPGLFESSGSVGKFVVHFTALVLSLYSYLLARESSGCRWLRSAWRGKHDETLRPLRISSGSWSFR